MTRVPLDTYRHALGGFTRSLAGRVAEIVESDDSPADLALVLDAIRETIAHLIMLEYECVRTLDGPA